MPFELGILAGALQAQVDVCEVPSHLIHTLFSELILIIIFLINLNFSKKKKKIKFAIFLF